MDGRPENQRRLLVIAAAVLLAAGAVLFALDVRGESPDGDWQFIKPVNLPIDLSGTQLAEVEVDREVYANTQPSLGDLRLTVADAAGERETPYKLLVEAGDRRRAAVPVRIQDLGHVPNEHTSFILHVESAGDLHSEVEVQTTSANFQRRVSVSASDDGATWRVLEEDGRIFNLTIPERGFSAGDTRVRYPASGARFLRVRIFDEGHEPLAVQGAAVFFSQQLRPRRHQLPLDIVRRADDPDLKRTVLLVDAGSPGFPVNTIQLGIPQRNFYRQVSLEGSHDSMAWIPLQSGEVIYNFDTPRVVGDDREIRFPESRHRYYRITVFNEDNPPLPVETAQADGFIRKIIFDATTGETYRLYYGNPRASAPSYELERLFPYLVTENLPAARLGPQDANPAFDARPPPSDVVPFTERYPWLLPLVVAVAALLVGLFLASLIRQVGGRLRPPEE